MRKIIKALKNPRLAIIYLLNQKIFRLIPDKLYIKIKYLLCIGKKLDLNNPQGLNEKMQWLKLYDRNPLYTNLVDKYKVREYIKNAIGEEYLIPLLGVYDGYDEIDFNSLPKEFVLKPNHTSGDIYICHDKDKIDHRKLEKDIKRWLKRKYYWIHREWPYKNVKPRIVCEKYMVDHESGDMKDYKIECFNGKATGTYVCLQRESTEGLAIDYYDINWNFIPGGVDFRNSGILLPKPKNFNKMIEIAEELSKDIPYVRIDLYEINGQVYFGELTFFPGAGFVPFKPDSFDDLLGSWLELPSKKLK